MVVAVFGGLFHNSNKKKNKAEKQDLFEDDITLVPEYGYDDITVCDYDDRPVRSDFIITRSIISVGCNGLKVDG